MTRNIKLTIEYDGTHFQGWQTQKNGRTVQDAIQAALKKIFGKAIKVIGAGRTDSGVHALGQVANFNVKTNLSLKAMRNALNANLPEDVTVLNVEEVRPDFHAQYDAKSKVYRYTVLHRDTRCAQLRHFVLLYPRKLNVPLMRQELKFFVGKKDFKAFQGTDKGSENGRLKSSLRTIKRIDIKKKGDFLYIDVEADGFLYKMVRNIVGTLLEVGSGKLPRGSIQKILRSKNRKYAGATVRARGLTLVKVDYEATN